MEETAQAYPVTNVLYLNVWAETYRALPFERFVCLTPVKSTYSPSAVLLISLLKSSSNGFSMKINLFEI